MREVDERLKKDLELTAWRREVIWSSVDGAVVGWVWVAREDAPWLYLSAGMHGDEPAGPLAVAAMMTGGVLDLRFNWLVCPVLNPCGFAREQRENAEGVDLNRDYFYRASEEVRAHIGWLEKFPVPSVMFSLHEDWEATGFYFYEINLHADQPERARRLLAAVEQEMRIEPLLVIDDHEVRERGWIYHVPSADFPESWPEAIYMAERGCGVSLTFETPSMAYPIHVRVAAQVVAVREMLGVM